MYNRENERTLRQDNNEAENKPTPEIPRPSTTPITNPVTIPGIDRTDVMPENDTINMPEERPIPLEFPELNPNKTNLDENTPPSANNQIGFH